MTGHRTQMVGTRLISAAASMAMCCVDSLDDISWRNLKCLLLLILPKFAVHELGRHGSQSACAELQQEQSPSLAGLCLPGASEEQQQQQKDSNAQPSDDTAPLPADAGTVLTAHSTGENQSHGSLMQNCMLIPKVA